MVGCFNTNRYLSACFAIGLALSPLYAQAGDTSKNEADSDPSRYVLGNGLKVGNTGITLGGYASLEYSDLKDTKSDLAVSHASLFVSWESSQLPLQFFSEIDSQYQFANDTADKNGRGDGGVRALALERLYFDYSFDDAFTLRAGKFLTPFGRWNLIHADPLVWTTSRPLITENLFSDNATGLMGYGNVTWLGQSLDYSLFGSPGGDPHKTADQDEFTQALGGHINVPVTEYTQVGFSYISFSQQNEQNNHYQLFGIDLLWKYRDNEIMAEYAYRLSNQGGAYKAGGGYLQGVHPLWGRLFGIIRLENMHDQGTGNSTHLCIVGLNFRQSRAISYKIEYQRNFSSTDMRPQGVMSSISVLF